MEMPTDPNTSTATRMRATPVSDFPTMLVGERAAALEYRVRAVRNPGIAISKFPGTGRQL